MLFNAIPLGCFASLYATYMYKAVLGGGYIVAAALSTIYFLRTSGFGRKVILRSTISRFIFTTQYLSERTFGLI